MKAVIIEDEIPAQQILQRLIKKYFPELEIAAIMDSIAAATGYLRSETPDIVFMDVELSDGKCFGIFEEVDIKCPVIITTAYEDYALDAFKAKCMDYLLKPIEPLAFRESVSRCMQFLTASAAASPAKDLSPYTAKAYKHHFTIKVGNSIIVVDVKNIAYFYSNDKTTFLVTKDGKQYMTDESLISIESVLDPSLFYKISRKCIVGLSSIYTISRYLNSRLRVTLAPKNIEPIIVPRDRVQNFLEWIEGGNSAKQI